MVPCRHGTMGNPKNLADGPPPLNGAELRQWRGTRVYIRRSYRMLVIYCYYNKIMKRLLFSLFSLFILSGAVCAYAQAEGFLPQASDFNQLQKGTAYTQCSDRKGKKCVRITVLDVTYKDSTDKKCTADVLFGIRGNKFDIGKFEWYSYRLPQSRKHWEPMFGPCEDCDSIIYMDRHKYGIACRADTVFIDADSVQLLVSGMEINDMLLNTLAYNGDEFIRFPMYDGKLVGKLIKEREKRGEYETVMAEITSFADSVADKKFWCRDYDDYYEECYEILTETTYYRYVVEYAKSDSSYIRTRKESEGRLAYEKRKAEREWWDEHGDEVTESARRKAYGPDYASYEVWLEFVRQELERR